MKWSASVEGKNVALQKPKMQQNVLMICKVSVLNKKDKESMSCHGSNPLLISRKMDSVIVKVDSMEKSAHLSEIILEKKENGLIAR